MVNSSLPQTRTRQPSPSYQKHRREFTRQILLPILLVTLAGLGLGGLAIYGAAVQSDGVSLWADIAIIWLIVPMMLVALLKIALLVGLVYGLSKLLNATPHYTGLVQQYALWLNAEIVLWTEKLIRPVLNFKAWMGIFSKRKR